MEDGIECQVHAYTWISASNRLAVRGPESSRIPPLPVSETTGEAVGVLREESDGEKVGVINDGVSPVFLAKGEYAYFREEGLLLRLAMRLGFRGGTVLMPG